jgi:hypothetical protein
VKVLVQHSRLGFEFDWLACDALGHCFFLSTAGMGWIPEPVDAPSYPSAVIDLLMGLPQHCEAAMHEHEGNLSEWQSVAQRGFYAMDWEHWHDRYRLIAEPHVPLMKSALPPGIRLLAEQLTVNMEWATKKIHGPQRG